MSAPPAPVLCASVDIDGLALYRDIHGIGGARNEAPSTTGDPVWTLGVTRFLELFAALDVRATFFAVTRDLGHPAHFELAREILRQGHELASHSHTHPYDLVRLPEATWRDELHRADDALRRVTGGPVAGYRAPGYNQSPAILAELVALGYRYDSSAFPCPPYVLAKAAIIAAKQLRGRHSRSIISRPLDSLGPRTPYEQATPNGSLMQLPITVLPGLRFPLIGTSLTMFGPQAVRPLAAVAARQDYLNIEFHALDLLDLTDPDVPADLAIQPDLRVPVARKRETFRRFLARVRENHDAPTLADCARA